MVWFHRVNAFLTYIKRKIKPFCIGFRIGDMVLWVKCLSVRLLYCFDHVHVTTQIILNKIIEKKYVGSMVWPWCCLLQHRLQVGILIRYCKLSVTVKWICTCQEWKKCTYIALNWQFEFTKKWVEFHKGFGLNVLFIFLLLPLYKTINACYGLLLCTQYNPVHLRPNSILLTGSKFAGTFL